MNILGLDVGSSSVKAGIVRNGRVVGKISRAPLTTHFHGNRAEVNPADVLRAVAKAISELGSAARRADAIALSVMSPAWVAMDRAGKPLTPLVTHQDRRSVKEARQLERRVGRRNFLHISGNLPVPGGISATTLAWFVANHPSIIRRADLLGHLNTFLHRQMTGQRVIDSSNASFTGLYETISMGGWSQKLCRAAGADRAKLPEIMDAETVGGYILLSAARRFSLTQGMPMMAGMIDTGAAMLLAPPRVGQMLNVSGSTDVLALCVNKPRPDERLITRTLGTLGLWLSVSTIAAAGSAIGWMKNLLFRELSDHAFFKLVNDLAKSGDASTVTFDPYLAGDRMSLEQRRAAFGGLTLATTRQDMLLAVVNSLATNSAARIALLQSRGVKIRRSVLLSGGTADAMHHVLCRDWPGRWTFRMEVEASLRGLSMLTPKTR